MRLGRIFLPLLPVFYTASTYAESASSPTFLGGELEVRPAYDGSRSEHVEFIPLLMFEKGPWFARTTEGILEGGAQMRLLDDFNIGLQAGYEEGRHRGDARFLKKHDVPNLDPSLSLGGFIQYQKNIGPVPIDLLARYRKDVDTSRGAQVDLRVTAGVYGGEDKRFNAEVYAQATWASANTMQSYYGLTTNEASRTGLSAFHPGSGHLSNQIGLWWSYSLASHWSVVGDIERHQLQGDAKNSPLTEVRYNNYLGLGVAYEY